MLGNNDLLINYVIAYASLGLVLLILAAFILCRRAKRPVHIIFAFYSLSISSWSLFTIPMIISNNREVAYLWDKVCLFGAVFIPATFLHFVLVYINKIHRHKKLVISSYFVAILFVIADIGGFLFADVQPRHVFKHYTVPNITYTLYVAYFSLASTVGIYFLYQNMRNKELSGSLRKQGKLLFLFSLLGYTGGATNFLLVYGYEIPLITPVANYAILIYGLAVAYLIFRHQFLDIEVIIKKTLVFTGLFAALMAIVVGVSTLTQGLLGRYLNIPQTVTMAISVV